MKRTLTKIGGGAFADAFGCQKEGWEKLAIKVNNVLVNVFALYHSMCSQIIPIEGNAKYKKDEEQNTYESIQPEVVVSL